MWVPIYQSGIRLYGVRSKAINAIRFCHEGLVLYASTEVGSIVVMYATDVQS